MALPDTFEIRVSPEQSSCILVRAGCLRDLNRTLAGELTDRAVVIVSDENVAQIFSSQVVDQLRASAGRVETVVLPAGEETKGVGSLTRLWDRFAQSSLNRDAIVVALGGGVIGDLAGFAAATYARGLAWIGLPTSLMAQIDSGIGGKVAVNLPAAKNLVGAFWQPTRVLIDPLALSSLGERDFRSGLAEVVKYAVIEGPARFERLEQTAAAILARDAAALGETIAACVSAKVAIVSADPLERTGRRAVLNLGHTFGHALETVAGYGKLSHGEAVAIGLVCAARLAEALGHAPGGLTERLRDLLRTFGLPHSVKPHDPARIVQAMSLDKKNRAGRLRLVLAKRLGQIECVDDVPPDRILNLLREVEP
jgi:3-dehydroquinate synthase